MRYLVLAAIWCGVGLAQGPASTGQVEGRVSNSVTGEPLRKVLVTLRGGSGDYSATSDASGHYSIDKVAAGNYRLTAQRQNFSILNYSSQIVVTAGGSVTGTDLKLVPFGVISGKVTDEDGDPVTGVQVTVMKWGFSQGGRRLQSAGGNGLTNDRGEYRIFNLPPGKYVLSAQGRDAEAIAMTSLALSRMRNASGPPPVRETYVPTYYPSARDVAAAATIPLGAGQEAPGMDIQVRKARVYSIQGHVSGVGKGSRITVYRYPKDGAGSSVYSGMAMGMRQEDGSFTFANTPSGMYTLVARDDRSTVARQDVVVGDNDVDGVVLTVTEPGSVKGRLRFEGTGKVQGTRVWLSTVEGPPMNSPTALTGETGSFEMADVAPERYRVMCVPPGGSYIKTMLWNGHPSTDGVVELTGGTASLEVVFAATSAQIEGDVKRDDQSAAGVRVLLVPGSRRESEFRSVMSDAKGHFLAKGVAPGSYTALAVEGELYGMPDPVLLKSLEKSGGSVTVDENGHGTVQLQVITEAALEALP